MAEMSTSDGPSDEQRTTVDDELQNVFCPPKIREDAIKDARERFRKIDEKIADGDKKKEPWYDKHGIPPAPPVQTYPKYDWNNHNMYDSGWSGWSRRFGDADDDFWYDAYRCKKVTQKDMETYVDGHVKDLKEMIKANTTLNLGEEKITVKDIEDYIKDLVNEEVTKRMGVLSATTSEMNRAMSKTTLLRDEVRKSMAALTNTIARLDARMNHNVAELRQLFEYTKELDSFIYEELNDVNASLTAIDGRKRFVAPPDEIAERTPRPVFPSDANPALWTPFASTVHPSASVEAASAVHPSASVDAHSASSLLEAHSASSLLEAHSASSLPGSARHVFEHVDLHAPEPPYNAYDPSITYGCF